MNRNNIIIDIQMIVILDKEVFVTDLHKLLGQTMNLFQFSCNIVRIQLWFTFVMNYPGPHIDCVILVGT